MFNVSMPLPVLAPPPPSNQRLGVRVVRKPYIPFQYSAFNIAARLVEEALRAKQKNVSHINGLWYQLNQLVDGQLGGLKTLTPEDRQTYQALSTRVRVL